jgi:cell wall-associated NlpC family hydrolase
MAGSEGGGLNLPEPLGIDSSLPTGNVDLSAPQFDLQVPVASMDSFQRAMDMAGTTPDGFSNTLRGVPEGGDDDLRSRVVAYGKKFLGMPYHWGGTSPSTSFDCSGLVQYVTGKFGLNLPRISYAQANSGRRTDIANLRPGDLVAWDNSSRNPGADHIAIYVGNGMILEAARTGTDIRIRKLGKREGAWGVALKYPGER